MRSIKPLTVALLAVVSAATMAGPCRHHSSGSTVKLPLSAETWVQTHTALVQVAIDASVPGSELANVQGHLQADLSRLAPKADWHIVSLNQQTTSSGLLQVHAVASARLGGEVLNQIHAKVKSISKPGLGFSIDSIAFVPSQEELRAAKLNLRKTIYAEAEQEVAALSQSFNGQTFYISDIDFSSSQPSPLLRDRAMILAANAMPSQPAVSQQLSLTANVTLQSRPVVSTDKGLSAHASQ